jgi:hypothetical protein
MPATSATETTVEPVTRLEWSRSAGGRGTARGVDIFTVRDGKIAEKPTYVTTG